MKHVLLRIAALAVVVTACGDGLLRMTSLERNYSVAIGGTFTGIKGDNQTGAAGALLPIELRFALRDSAGTGIPGALVNIAVTAGGGSTSRSSVTTSTNGQAAFRWTLGASGRQNVTIRLDSSRFTHVFTARVIPAGSQLQVVNGNNQVGEPGAQLAAPIVVRLVTAGNEPLGNIAVRFKVNDGSGGSPVTTTVATDSNGHAQTRWELGWNTNHQQIVASVPGLASTFDAQANTTGWRMRALRGNNQSGPASTQLGEALQLLVRDADGNPIPNAKGTFAVALGGGSITTTKFTTNSQGRAATRWTLGASGTQRVTATIGAVGTATWNATIN